jgi:hypothetical protein
MDCLPCLSPVTLHECDAIHHLVRSGDARSTNLGVLLAGAGNVPIEMETPEERTRFTVEDSDNRFIITPLTSVSDLPRRAGRAWLWPTFTQLFRFAERITTDSETSHAVGLPDVTCARVERRQPAAPRTVGVNANQEAQVEYLFAQLGCVAHYGHLARAMRRRRVGIGNPPPQGLPGLLM